MTDVYLKYSRQFAETPMPKQDVLGQKEVIQRHNVICNAEDGAVYDVHSLSKDAYEVLVGTLKGKIYQLPFKDVDVVGPVDKEKLVFLEDRTGPVSQRDIIIQMETQGLLPQEISRVRQAIVNRFPKPECPKVATPLSFVPPPLVHK